MVSFNLMVEEHNNIKRMLKVNRKYCYRILQGKEVNYDNFIEIIDFIRNYADKHHHGKEEKLLFNKMVEELNPAIKKTIEHGMFVEHDMGRYYVQALEKAVQKVKSGDDEARLDVIANALAYNDLLERHINKEDNILYKYAAEHLSPATLEILEKQCIEFEETAKKNGIQKKYLELLEKLERTLQEQ